MKNYVNIDLIERFIKEKELTHTQFCKQCKISYHTFLKIQRGDYSIKINALFKISKTMKIHIKELFLK